MENVSMFYDSIAEEYDIIYSAPEFLEEDKKLVVHLPVKGQILDVGCGTGHLLEMVYILPEHYLGIDKSRRMIKVASRKFPKYKFLHAGILDVQGMFDTIIALYGVASYMTVKELNHIPRLLSEHGKYFLMFYKPNYVAYCYRVKGYNKYRKFIKSSPEMINLPGMRIFEFTNYWVVVNFEK